jgi:hypothetical protein
MVLDAVNLCPQAIERSIHGFSELFSKSQCFALSLQSIQDGSCGRPMACDKTKSSNEIGSWIEGEGDVIQLSWINTG